MIRKVELRLKDPVPAHNYHVRWFLSMPRLSNFGIADHDCHA